MAERPFVSVREAAEVTGLSCWFLRREVQAGRCPHIRSGRKIYINLPALLRQLQVESEGEEE